MKNFARINTASTAETTYYADDYLVYSGQLYRVIEEISSGAALNPGENGNITAAYAARPAFDATRQILTTTHTVESATGCVAGKVVAFNFVLRSTSGTSQSWEEIATLINVPLPERNIQILGSCGSDIKRFLLSGNKVLVSDPITSNTLISLSGIYITA
jgi:hypothetical protein